MRLLLAFPNLIDDATIGVVATGLAREYARRGHRVTVAGLIDPARGGPSRERRSWGELRRLGGRGSGRRLTTDARLFAAGLRALARESDFVHLQTIGRWRGAERAAAEAFRGCRVPYGITFQDYHPEARAGFDPLLSRAAWAAGLSRFLCRSIAAAHPRAAGRLHEIPNGCELAPARARPAPGRRPYVLTLARQERYKGLDVLLMAWRGICERRPDLELVIAGRPWTVQPDYYPGLARALGIARRVRFAGLVDARRAAALVRGCLVYAQPSRRESFGIALREAMSAGKAVVATRSGGPEEAVTHGRTGLLVPPGEAQALERALDRVIGDEGLRARLGRAALRRAAGWRWRDVAQRYLALIEEAAHGT